MQQVLFRLFGFPLYGFAVMLFLAFLLCTWLAGRRAEEEGIRKEHIQDMALWVFIAGIIGARLTFLHSEGRSLWEFWRIWEGGLVFYGSAVGGLIGYALAYYFVIRKHGLSTWQLADIVAPSIAVGLCLGRIGCFLNGCCYGTVATCPDCPGVHFPLSSLPRFKLVEKGYQTAAGFTIRDLRQTYDDFDIPPEVGAIEAGSPAAESGLQSGDIIVKADDQEIGTFRDLAVYLTNGWPQGKQDLTLTVKRGGQQETLPSFRPRTLGLHPTQLYESVSMFLVLCLLLAYYPFRRHTGELVGILMFCYGIHRYLDELLRDDPRPWWEGDVSLFLVVAGLAVWIWRRWMLQAVARQEAPVPAKVA